MYTAYSAQQTYISKSKLLRILRSSRGSRESESSPLLLLYHTVQSVFVRSTSAKFARSDYLTALYLPKKGPGKKSYEKRALPESA